MPLPAPYAPPWKRLGEDGVAMLAWLGLKLREWARRNREGTLPVPSFWPRRWLRLFWPLVLVGLLLASLALSRFWLAGGGASRGDGLGAEERASASPRQGGGPVSGAARESLAPPVVSPQSVVEPPPQLADRDPTRLADAIPDGLGQARERGGVRESALATGGEMEPQTGRPEARVGVEGAGAGTGEAGEASATGAPLETANPFGTASPTEIAEPTGSAELAGAAEPAGGDAPSPSEADLLLAEWSADDPDASIDAIRAEPAAATLTLQLNERVLRLSAAKRERQAERWLERATELGYTHLRLVDGQQRLLGREARVGGGMILLRPAEPERTLP